MYRMEQYKKEFIEFMIDCQVLKFGDFVTKSGRKTPFFVNTGYYRTGSQLKKLGEYYAKAIAESFGTDFDVLFGPAYKGIPLSVATAIALSENHGADVRYCSNRKEVKDHGDVGILLGGPINDGDRVMMIEDVTLIRLNSSLSLGGFFSRGFFIPGTRFVLHCPFSPSSPRNPSLSREFLNGSSFEYPIVSP